MVKKEKLLFLFILLALMRSYEGAVYKVGDSAGWSIIGNVDYNKWASSKNFRVGDILLFEYDPLYHNVRQVSRSDFHSCDSTSPIATYSTGNDSITIRSPGHYYYICSFLGHCQAGQKVDVRVTKSVRPADIPSPNPSEAPMLASPIGPVESSPSTNTGVSLLVNNSNYFVAIVGCCCSLLFWLYFSE
ncbi:hypothetical protein ACJIZ3_011753 [Penstemon smallii]|uniref:Phytocyanin domain-containing protein n=1 Tax=Penstemon smallii TaxID=265156 RepID=A0ABD3UM73_9LAMI